MSLQESLRELVSSRGPGVTADATEFRGALDDFLGEDEATTGEVNLLVDAVRLGGLSRLVSLLDAGASPQAAVMEAGVALARDRGSDDDRRSRWAVAVLGYAVGRLDATSVPTQGAAEEGPAGSGGVGAVSTSLHQGSIPPPPPPPAPSGQPWSAPVAAPVPGPPSGTVYADASPGPAGPADLTTPAGPAGLPPRPLAPPVAPAAPRRRGVGLVVLAIALVLGLAAGVGFAVWQTQRGDDSADGSSDGSSSGDGSDAAPGALPASDIVVDNRDPAGNSRLYAVDPDAGEWTPLTFGPDDYLPAISPDRTKIDYLVGATAPRRVWELHLAWPCQDTCGTFRPPFSKSGACAHALRPGWSPDGDKLAIVCTGGDSVTDGLFTTDAVGGGADVADESDDFLGSPTWTDEDHFVYLRTSTPTTIWQYDDSAPDGAPHELSVTPADGSTLPDGAIVSHLDWSDDQQRLLFLVHTPDPATGVTDEVFGALWTAEADGTDARPVGGDLLAHPVWAPAGDGVAAVAKVPGGEALVTLHVSDPSIHIVPNAPKGRIGIPVWGSR